jgi:hypothetical protein
MIICSNCNIEKNDTYFYNKHKQCKECVLKKQKCEHGKHKTICKECGGSQICEHNNRKQDCKNCNGCNICEHNIQKRTCRICDGGSFCEHNIIKSRCKECKGGSICEHNKRKSLCKECDGSGFCEHKIRKEYCKECKGVSLCEHKIRKDMCRICEGIQICVHKKQIHFCIICRPDSKYFCKECRIFQVKKEPYLCSYCNPIKIKKIKMKEIKLKKFLENNYKFEYNICCNYDNKRYYPDFKIKCKNYWIIIECDEKAHETYSIIEEKIRENNIYLALNLPCIFLRFNPDKKDIKINIKYKILKSYIDYYMNKENVLNTIEYLFY